MIARNIQVFGKVQGVFYRASTKQKADELELKGWVKNEADGSVSINVEGDEISVDEFVQWCRKGPLLAQVDQIKETNVSIANYSHFEVRY